MQIGVLGPLRVTVGGREVRLPAKQQVLLAILALQPNRTVSTDRLIEALWGEDTSPAALKTLQSHVFHLRRLLVPGQATGSEPSEHAIGSMIVTDGRGYRLAVEPEAIDAREFERLFGQGRAASPTDPQRAIETLERALDLWRGPGMPDVGDEPVASAEIARLTELRAEAFDQLIQVRFALGQYEQAIPELRREVHESPFREQLWADLMVALVRDRRKAEALIAYRDATAALRQELDVEPSLELQALAARIRDGDPSLQPISVPAVSTSGKPVTPDGHVELPTDPVVAPVAARAPGEATRGPDHRTTWFVFGGVAAAAVALGALAFGLSLLPRSPGIAPASPSPEARPERSAGLSLAPFPDADERDLLARLPARITDTDTCSRAPAMERTGGAVASVRCDLPPGSGADTVWYEVLEPPGAVRQRYLDPVRDYAIEEGDCQEDPRAWQAWPEALRGSFSGHIVCYPDTDGARLMWSYDALGVLARARRPDGDSAELWRWWTGVGPFLRY
jgi:YD repeat-containing protein